MILVNLLSKAEQLDEQKRCRLRAAHRRYRERHPERTQARQREYQDRIRGTPTKMLYAVRGSAKARGLECTITEADIVIPEVCPILGLRLESCKRGTWGGPQDAYPSVDRLDSSKGYVPGNVAVISWRANMIKSVGTAEEHEKIAAWMRSKGVK